MYRHTYELFTHFSAPSVVVQQYPLPSFHSAFYMSCDSSTAKTTCALLAVLSFSCGVRTVTTEPIRKQARQVEMFILKGGQKQKIVAPRWRAMTGKRLLRLEHGVPSKSKGRRRPRRGDGNGNGNGNGAAGAEGDSGGKVDEVDGPPLSGLGEEGSDTSSSSGSGSDDDGR